MLRTRILAAATAAVLMLGMSVGGAGAAFADEAPPADLDAVATTVDPATTPVETLSPSAAALKVYVCKYVGTPGVNEVLQTGNNPISVSVNAIPNYQGVGSYFADAQGRSYVLAEDTTTGGGQSGEPSVSECPDPEGPPAATNVTVRVTFMCKVTTAGTITNAPGTYAAGDYVFRIRHEAGPATDFTAGVGGSGLFSGNLSVSEVEYYTTKNAVAGVSVKTTPLPNTYLGTASTNETACGTPQPILEVGLYLYKKLNPDAPAAWSNSGPQRFIASQSGSSWFTEFPTVLPEDVCGEGWAVQQDKVSHTGGFTWPATLEYPDDTIGWPPIYAAKHDNLEQYIDVPDCEPPTLPALGVVAASSQITCDTDGWFEFGPGIGVTDEEAALMEWTVGPAEYAGATATGVKHSVSKPVTITVTVSLVDSAQGDYTLSDESGGGSADPETGAITYTFQFDAPVDCPVVVPEITWVDECVMEDIELELVPSALVPVASFTVTASPNVSYSYTVDGGSPIDVVFPLGEDTVTIAVTPGSTVVVTASAASGFVLPEGYEPWQKTFDVSAACIDLPPLANWPASASATAQVCSPLGSLVSGSITVVFPEGSVENPDPVRYFIGYGTAQEQELTSSVTSVAPGSYVVTAIPTVPTDSINDSGDRADFPLTVAAADADCGQLDTLAFTGAGAVTSWLGVAAVLMMVAGMGFVIRRNRVEV